MSGDGERLFPHRGRGEVNGRASSYGLPAGEAPLAVGNDRGVAGGHADLIGRHAELLGADLRECGLDALAHGHSAGVDGNASGAADAHDAGFERAAAGALDAVAEANAEIAAIRAHALLARGKAGVVDRFERAALQAREI